MSNKNIKVLARLGALTTLTLGLALGGPLIGLIWPGHVRVTRAANGGDYRSGEIIVQLNPAAGATIGAINGAYGTVTIKPLTTGVGVYLLKAPAGQDAAAVAAAMAGDARLLFAHPNFINEPPEANPRTTKSWGGLDAGPYLGQYANSMLNLPAAQAISKGNGSVVAVIDTGVQLAHPALQGKLTAARYDFIDDDANPDDVENHLDDDGDGMIDEAAGHGTHVAGIVLLVAPEAKIMPIRVLDSDGIGDDVQIVRAIEFAVINKANVINLSLGTAADSKYVDDAVRRAAQAGVVVISAAGNLNSKDKQYPAADNCSLAVSSVSPNDIKSSFSNYGSWVDVTAPGENIPSALPPSGYGSWSGTSMATPFAAGQAALIHSLRPDLNPYQVLSVIAGTAQSISEQNPDFGSDLGAGRIDVGASLTLLKNGGPIPEGGGVISSSCIEPGEPFATVTPTPSTSPTVPAATNTPSPTSATPAATLTPAAMTPRAFFPLLQR